jgi:hypothetical protein
MSELEMEACLFSMAFSTPDQKEGAKGHVPAAQAAGNDPYNRSRRASSGHTHPGQA